MNQTLPVYTQSFIEAGVRSGKFVVTEIGLEKLCTLCGDYWPADTQFFYPKAGKLSSECKACAAEKAMARRGVTIPGSGQAELDL